VPIGARGSDVHGTEMFCGHAVVRLGRRHRLGLLFRPLVPSAKPGAAVRASTQRGRVSTKCVSTLKSE
jgi:hypothetical protein